MRIAYVAHSLRSCWNHGNAHFLRGVLRELVHLGHDVRAYEPAEAWSVANLVADHGAAALGAWAAHHPELAPRLAIGLPAAEALLDADVVLVHEWTDPAYVAELGRLRTHGGGRATLLFHDTHHRAVSAPDEMARYDLAGYDGVLAFGEALAHVYRVRGWGQQVFTWHEAADTRLFRPPPVEGARAGLVWIGNWGDGERTSELERFLLAPAQAAGLRLDVHGVRYPAEALATLDAYGARWHGWAPNASVPRLFASHLATVHVLRRFYATALPGIPTIRVFEALACGIPLACAPWEDTERLFTPGVDYLVARDGAEMTRHLKALAHDAALRAALAAHGLATIAARHTCAHRARELLGIVATLRAARPVAA